MARDIKAVVLRVSQFQWQGGSSIRKHLKVNCGLALMNHDTSENVLWGRWEKKVRKQGVD